jgi:hypothetical protein
MQATTIRVMPGVIFLLVSLLLWIPGPAQTNAAPPPESLMGLTPGKATLADALRILGRNDVSLPGSMTYFSGGGSLSLAYRWSPGSMSPWRGITVETDYGSDRVNLVMIDTYPGLGTSRGLTTLVSDDVAVRLYGMPDFVFEWRIGYTLFRELFYLDEGVHLVLSQLAGRPNWTITRLILTYPAYLRNGVSWRMTMVSQGARVEEIGSNYRVWARLAIPPE